MILYLLKSAACLLILLLVHQFLLQRESMHRFNRFFLLFSVVVSFLIPIYIIEVAAIPVVEESRKFEIFENVVQSEFPETNINSESIPIAKDLDFQEKNSIPWTVIFWSVYLSITLVFLIRFVRNIHILADKISRNLHISYRGETLVLLAEKSLPFTFLKYIFVSKTYFEEGKLTEAIFAHERAHLREKHSLDLLFIELLLVFFWFHPGLYFARQAIKLNHEFIADQAALQATTLEQYQSQLLSMMVSGQNFKLASSLNFSLTKKRFEMMRRKTANSTKWIKVFGVIPVLAALVYFFSEKVTAQAEVEKESEVVVKKAEGSKENEIQIQFRVDGKIEVDGQIIEVEQLAELIDSGNNEIMTARISAYPGVKMGFVADVQKVLRDKDIRRAVYQQHPEGSDLSHRKDSFYRNATFFVEDKKGDFIKKGYEELSSDERSYLIAPANPPSLKIPSPENLHQWGNSNEYAIWLDGEAISKDKLAGLDNSDLVFFFSTFFPSGQRTTTYPQAYKIRLFTEDGYKKTFGASSGYASPLVEDDIFYIYPLTKRVNYGRTIVKSGQSPIDMYLRLYDSYSSRFEGKGDDDLSEWEQATGWHIFTELGGRYYRLSAANKKLVPRANRPEFQYWVPLTKDGVRYYKKQNELTEEEKKQLSPTPSPPNHELDDPEENHSQKIHAQTANKNWGEKISYSIVYSHELQSKGLKEYLVLFGKYQIKSNENRLFSQPTLKEIEALHANFLELQERYQKLSLEERRVVQRANFTYARLEEDGKVIFKKFEDLTEEERKTLAC